MPLADVLSSDCRESMKVTFADEVQVEARESLTWLICRCCEVGIPTKTLQTIKPGADRNSRDPNDRIAYSFDLNDEGDCHVTVL